MLVLFLLASAVQLLTQLAVWYLVFGPVGLALYIGVTLLWRGSLLDLVGIALTLYVWVALGIWWPTLVLLMTLSLVALTAYRLAR